MVEIENGQCYGQFVDAKKDKCEVNNGDHLDENEDNRKEKDENPDTTILLDRVFIGGGNRRAQRKPPTCRKSLTNFIT
jgi:hypothetical protein